MTVDAERYIRTRTIDAQPATVFALLSDPARHHETEPGDWVRGAIEPKPITEVGQVFGMQMYATGAGGEYVMHNRVTAFDQDRTIGWEPGQYDESGTLGTGGWWWRYDLAAQDQRTAVTLTYDWSAVPQQLREQLGGFPVFTPEFLDESLAALDRAIS